MNPNCPVPIGWTFRASMLVITAALGAGCLGRIGDAGDTDGARGPNADGDHPGVETAGLEPAPARLRILLSRQYRNAVRDLLGEGAAAVVEPPLDVPVNGYASVGAAQLALGDSATARYDTSARAAAAVAMANSARIAELCGCTPTGPADAACHEAFVGNFGRLAFRRPLADEERASWTKVAQATSAEYADFYAGVEYVIAGMLQAPSFLYRIEVGHPTAEDPTVRQLDAYELASKMSFFLIDTTPDAGLLDAAESGALTTPEGIRQEALKLLDRPAARGALGELYGEVLGLGNLDELSKDAQLYPSASPALGAAMREEALRLVEDVVWVQDTDARALVTADWTFVNADLARLYRMDPPKGGGFVKVQWPADQRRRGLMGQASFLSLFSHYASTSPTLRGQFVRTRLLCQSIGAPPPGVVTELPDSSDAKTMREKLATHQEDPSCAGCHKLMDPIGLALENFDALGAFRPTDNGAPIDTSGELNGEAFAGPEDLARVLADDPAFAACMVRTFFRHAAGHVDGTGEKTSMEALARSFADSGYRVQSLLAEIVSSEIFRLTGEAQ